MYQQSALPHPVGRLLHLLLLTWRYSRALRCCWQPGCSLSPAAPSQWPAGGGCCMAATMVVAQAGRAFSLQQQQQRSRDSNSSSMAVTAASAQKLQLDNNHQVHQGLAGRQSAVARYWPAVSAAATSPPHPMCACGLLMLGVCWAPGAPRFAHTACCVPAMPCVIIMFTLRSHP